MIMMKDNYSHDSCMIVYISENIPGPLGSDIESKEINNNFNSQIMNMCNCNLLCEPEKCQCILKSGGANSWHCGNGLDGNMTSLIFFDHFSKNSYPIYECNDLCNCSYACKNRYVQKGPIEGLYVNNCYLKTKGLALYTSAFIPKGTFVCEYAGEIISESEAVTRYNKNQEENKMNYIFCLQEFSNNDVIKTFVDPSYLGNIGRYVNHSCDANCVIIPVRVNTPIPKLAIFSCYDIEPHTEITFNYGLGKQSTMLPVATRKKCLCNSQNCTGWLPYDIF